MKTTREIILYIAAGWETKDNPLSKVRNLGKKSMDEIDHRLKDLYSFNSWDLLEAAKKIEYKKDKTNIVELINAL